MIVSGCDDVERQLAWDVIKGGDVGDEGARVDGGRWGWVTWEQVVPKEF